MATRGGRRHGTGRKLILNAMERLGVGHACEQLWQAACAEKEEKAQQAFIEKTDLGQVRAANASPKDADDFDLLASDVDEEVYAVTRSKGRLVSIPVTRPKGEKDHIAAQVAEKYGITSRLAWECWKEFRRAEKSQ